MAKAIKNDKVSIANICALIGLAALGVFSFFGLMFKSEDGQLGYSIIMTVAIVSILVFLLFMAIKAKQADSHKNRWKIVEIIAVSLYVVFAFLSSSHFQKFFYVTSQKTFLQAEARKEIAEIESLYTNYDKMVKDATTKAVEQMNNYIQSQTFSRSMENYIKMMHIEKKDINSWAVEVNKACFLKPDSTLREFSLQIESWDFMSIAQIAKELGEKSAVTTELINKKIRRNIEAGNVIPIIQFNGHTYIHTGFIEETFSAPSTGNFQKALNQKKGHTVLGWGLFILFHLLILLNYFVTQGSGIVEPSKKRKTRGSDL